MVRTRTNDYSSDPAYANGKQGIVDNEGSWIRPPTMSPSGRNVIAPPNPVLEKYPEHNMVPNATEGANDMEDPYMSANEGDYTSAKEEFEYEPPMARSILGQSIYPVLRNEAVKPHKEHLDIGGVPKHRTFPHNHRDSGLSPASCCSRASKVNIFTPRSNGVQKLPKIPMLPVLKDQLHLNQHLIICESVMEEEGVDLRRIAARVAICGTFQSFVELKQTAESMLHLSWEEMKASLLSDFADVNVIRGQLEDRLLKLKFDSFRMNAFLNAGRALWILRTPDIEQTWFVRRLFRTVPPDLLERVIGEARRLSPRKDWSTLPIEQIFGLLSDAVIVRNSVMQITGEEDSMKLFKDRKPRDKEQPKSPRNPSDMRAWIDSRKGRLFVVYTTGVEKWKLIKEAAKDFREAKSRRDGKSYWFVEFASKEIGSELLGKSLEHHQWREFKDTRPSN